jgi:dCTP deaminase
MARTTKRDGVLPDCQLRQLIAAGQIASDRGIDPGQIQPNSIDLRLGTVAHRTRCSFIPVGQPVEALLNRFKTHSVNLDDKGFVLEVGTVCVVPLMERLALRDGLLATANPKSSTGRLDILARVVTDYGQSFDVIPPGYNGPLFLEIITRSFPVLIRPGDTLAQLRVFRGEERAVSDTELRKLNDARGLIRDPDGVPISSDQLGFNDGVILSVDLNGNSGRDATVGFFPKPCPPVLDLASRNLSIKDYWGRVHRPFRESEPLILQPHAFYIFASHERVCVPPELCAEMVAFDVRSGEVRMHYAGFFDSGFGWVESPAEMPGGHIVLEVRNMYVPFHIRDKQQLFRVRFFKNAADPRQLYGKSILSNYQGQGLRLSKQFGQESSIPPQLPIRWMPPAALPPPARSGQR